MMLSDHNTDEQLPGELPDHQVKELLMEVRHQTILHWNYRRLRSLPKQLLEEGSHIRHIYLKRNLLTCLPENLGSLAQLTYCYLHGNLLKALPDSIGDVTCLQVLDVGNNKITSLPHSLAKLTSLRSLVAVYNKITSFPKDLCQLRSLSVLMLSGNNISYLPEAIGGLTGLQGLYIDHNQLKELPRSLASLPMLTRISCCCNSLTHLPAVTFVSRPTIFFDDNPRINYLPFSIVQQFRSGECWDPVVMQTCGCFQDTSLVNNTVHISPRRYAGDNTTPSLMLPPEISNITVATHGAVEIPSLRELCLRYVWKEKKNPRNESRKLKLYKLFNCINSTSLPSHLCELIELGPIATCEAPKCRMPIFTSASIIVLSITVTARLYIEGNIVPSVVYFCSDQCAKIYVQEVKAMVDEFSIWFRNRLEQACNIILY
ncbi:leucine-rich repeat-containing protein 28-like isoform X2 [Penaeus indicus]|uniref:leucine-rich repeat-containing protein 28-like isoform X2 n=1 Tax=Penaeus indicus TaxID=29960 RepID=UPI00300CE36A